MLRLLPPLDPFLPPLITSSLPLIPSSPPRVDPFFPPSLLPSLPPSEPSNVVEVTVDGLNYPGDGCHFFDAQSFQVCVLVKSI